MDNLTEQNSISPIVLNLFKGVIYREQNEKLWNDLLNQHNAVKDYISVLNLELVLNEADEYAFLKSKPDTEEYNYPKLIPRRALTFEVTLLLGLLRRALLEFEHNNSEVRLVLSQAKIIDLMKIYFSEQPNQAKLEDKLITTINKVMELGFLQKLKNQQAEPHFEVKKILKAFIDTEWLLKFDQWVERCLKGAENE